MKRRWLLCMALGGLILCALACRTAKDTSAPIHAPVDALPAQQPESSPIIRTIAIPEDGFPQLFLKRRDVRPNTVVLSIEGLAVTDKEFEAGLEYAKSVAGDGPQAEEAYARRIREELLLLAYLRDSKLMDDKDFEARARSLLRGQLALLVLDEVIRKQVTVTPEEIQQRYDRDSALYKQPHRVGVRLILVPSQAEAEEVRRRLQAGEDFGEIASQVSVHTSRSQGGKMEPFSRGTLTPQIEDLAFSLRPGETGTVETTRGVWIIQKTADSPESVIPLDQVRTQIEHQIYSEKSQAIRESFLRTLEQNAFAESASPDRDPVN